MQVRHIDVVQLDLAKAEKAELELPPAVQDQKPWEEIVECLALLAAVHMNPCQAAKERNTEEKQAEDEEDDNTDQM